STHGLQRLSRPCLTYRPADSRAPTTGSASSLAPRGAVRSDTVDTTSSTTVITVLVSTPSAVVIPCSARLSTPLIFSFNKLNMCINPLEHAHPDRMMNKMAHVLANFLIKNRTEKLQIDHEK